MHLGDVRTKRSIYALGAILFIQGLAFMWCAMNPSSEGDPA